MRTAPSILQPVPGLERDQLGVSLSQFAEELASGGAAPSCGRRTRRAPA
jgi:hypothetical protein